MTLDQAVCNCANFVQCNRLIQTAGIFEQGLVLEGARICEGGPYMNIIYQVQFVELEDRKG
jgi:hypothetical protein